MAGVVLEQPCVAELIITDDCSVDGSWDVLQCLAAQNPRIKVFRHEQNQGKGAALRPGIAKASAPIVLIQDADLEYVPKEYGQLIAPILRGGLDRLLQMCISLPSASPIDIDNNRRVMIPF